MFPTRQLAVLSLQFFKLLQFSPRARSVLFLSEAPKDLRVDSYVKSSVKSVLHMIMYSFALVPFIFHLLTLDVLDIFLMVLVGQTSSLNVEFLSQVL